MDVTPRALREVEFRSSLRGYHPDDVDEFLDRVAAGIEIMLERVRQANERAARAEQRLTQAMEQGVPMPAPSGPSETEDALRRTLVLAQRTADLAVQEAREQAARIVTASQAQAQALVAEAEASAKRTTEDALEQLRLDTSRLEVAREQLRSDVGALERYVRNERDRLRSAMSEALSRLDSALPEPSPLPLLHDRPTAEFTPPRGDFHSPDRARSASSSTVTAEESGPVLADLRDIAEDARLSNGAWVPRPTN